MMIEGVYISSRKEEMKDHTRINIIFETGTANPGESMATNQQRGKKSQPTFGGECECPGVAPVEAGRPRHVNAVHVVVD